MKYSLSTREIPRAEPEVVLKAELTDLKSVKNKSETTKETNSIVKDPETIKDTQQDPVKTDQIVKDHEEYKDVEMLKDLEKDKDTNNIPNLSLSVKHVVLSLRKKSH